MKDVQYVYGIHIKDIAKINDFIDEHEISIDELFLCFDYKKYKNIKIDKLKKEKHKIEEQLNEFTGSGEQDGNFSI